MLVALALDHLEERLVLGGIVFHLKPFLRQFCDQVFDGVALIELLVPGAPGGPIFAPFDDRSVTLLITG